MDRLKRKIALVTGAGQGIGRAIADLFAAEGAIVVATDVRGSDEILDVAEPADWDCVVQATVARHGAVDILVNNAGIVLAYEALHDTDLASWAKVVAVHQTKNVPRMRAVIPHMLRTGGGSISTCRRSGAASARRAPRPTRRPRERSAT